MKQRKENYVMREFQEMAAGCFAILMAGIFPLFYRMDYFRIREEKSAFFQVCTWGLIALNAIFAGAGWLQEKKETGFCRRAGEASFQKRKHSKRAEEASLPKKKHSKRAGEASGREWKEILRAVPSYSWFAGLFAVSLLLSTLFSVDVRESFLGTEGRKMGAALWLLCLAMYVILGKYLRPGIWLAWIFLISNGVVTGLAVLQFWDIDPIHIHDRLAVSWEYGAYISTVGNINGYSNYLCMILPVGMVLYYLSETLFSKIVYGIFLVMGFYSAYACNADSWILGVGTAFLVMFWFSFKDHEHMIHFLELCFLFFLSSLLIKASLLTLQRRGGDTTMSWGFQTLRIQSFMVHPYTLAAEIILLSAGMALLKRGQEKKFVWPYQKIRKALYTGLAVILGIGILLFLAANWRENREWEGTFEWLNLLKLQDEFGSGRGIIWKYTVKAWEQLPLWRKVIGNGVNCFHRFFHQCYGAELSALTPGILWADPHNELLQFLSMTGILGTIGYFGLLISTAVSAGKHVVQSPVMMMGTAAICSYLAQSMVNNPTTFITPNLFFLLGIVKSLERYAREKDVVDK